MVDLHQAKLLSCGLVCPEDAIYHLCDIVARAAQLEAALCPAHGLVNWLGHVLGDDPHEAAVEYRGHCNWTQLEWVSHMPSVVLGQQGHMRDLPLCWHLMFVQALLQGALTLKVYQ